MISIRSRAKRSRKEPFLTIQDWIRNMECLQKRKLLGVINQNATAFLVKYCLTCKYSCMHVIYILDLNKIANSLNKSSGTL